MRNLLLPAQPILFFIILVGPLNIFSVAPAYAQQQPGNWLMYFGSTRFHDKWSLHHEAQYRSKEFLYPNTEQILLRGGLTYHLEQHSSATAGYAFITNHHTSAGSKGIVSTEHRVWEQFNTRQSVGRVRMEHRYRLEQRWIKGDANRYLNRARYFYRITIPVSKKTLESKTFFVSFYDEIFLHLHENPFDRNRLYGALGYQISKDAAIQTGYLFQTIGNSTAHYLQYGLFWNIDLRDKE